MTAQPLPAAEQARLDAIEAAPAAAESLRERMARAIAEADGCDRANWPGVYEDRADAAIDVLRGPSSDAVLPMCWDLAPVLNFDGVPTQQYHCELPHGHGGAHRSSEGNPDFPMYWMRAEADEVDCGHHSWAGLMALLDEHWPADVFPTGADDPGRDAAVRIVSLLRWVARLRQTVERVLALAGELGTRYPDAPPELQSILTAVAADIRTTIAGAGRGEQ